MHPSLKALLGLAIPMALTVCSPEALARKHRKHHAEEAAPPPAAPPEPPEPPAAAAATVTVAPAPTAAVSAVVETPAVVTPVTVAVTSDPAAAAAPPPPPPPPPPPRDRVRFRGGISASGGGEFISGFAAGLGGVDGRLGVQIRNLVGIYLQPHVSFGAGTVGGISGLTGNIAATAMVDFTFLNRAFVGVGVGGGLVNNPGGALVQFRAGGYPVVKVMPDRPRRKGLMVGVDVRAYFISFGPVLQVMAGLGYEAF